AGWCCLVGFRCGLFLVGICSGHRYEGSGGKWEDERPQAARWVTDCVTESETECVADCVTDCERNCVRKCVRDCGRRPAIGCRPRHPDLTCPGCGKTGF